MLSVLRYHQTSVNFFKQQSTVWQFFASRDHMEDQLERFKTDLLKNTYKFDPITDHELYQKVNVAKEKLGLQLSVSVYQGQQADEMNASIVYINGEAHIVFSGKLIQALTDEELLAIIAHELSHVQLYTQLNGEVEVADRIITAIGNNADSTPAHYETARLFRLYTEIFCDRGAYLVTGSYQPIITSLVKLVTGLQTVNADSYIKQAEEIFAMDSSTKASGVSHPENFIRTRAIHLWHTKGNDADSSIQQMIEGHAGLDELDLYRQQYITATTLQLLQLLLQPSWMQSAHIMALGKQYFGDIQLSTQINTGDLLTRIETLHPNLKDYLAYVLYDFSVADKQLEDLPLGYCFYIASELKLDKHFATAVKKERKLTDKKTNVLKQQTLAEYAKQGSLTV